MADFVGQKTVFIVSLILLALSIPASIIYAFIVDNYLKGLNIVLGVSAFVMVAFGPNWPYLNRNKPKWQPDSMVKDQNVNEKKPNKMKTH